MIINTAFDKTRAYPIGHGWDNRPKGYGPSSIIIHTTNNRRVTLLTNELQYLHNSSGVSCHDVIPREGEIVYIIVPTALRAWHAGAAELAFLNSRSIGIELHNSIGQKPTAPQIALLTHRVKQYIHELGIKKEMIDTHRRVALPAGRKSDPEGWPDTEFYRWRDSLFTQETPQVTLVIGTKPSATLAQCRTFLNNTGARALLDPHFDAVTERFYTMCVWLDIDPAFVIALSKHETMQVPNRIWSSDLVKKSNNVGGIKAYSSTDNVRWPLVKHNNRLFNVYESIQLGLFGLVFHLKQIYGARGRLHLEEIIPVWAPSDDANNPNSYMTDVRRTMVLIQSL